MGNEALKTAPAVTGSRYAFISMGVDLGSVAGDMAGWAIVDGSRIMASGVSEIDAVAIVTALADREAKGGATIAVSFPPIADISDLQLDTVAFRSDVREALINAGYYDLAHHGFLSLRLLGIRHEFARDTELGFDDRALVLRQAIVIQLREIGNMRAAADRDLVGQLAGIIERTPAGAQ